MLDRALRIVTILAVGALGAIGMALSESLLVGGVAWFGFVLFVLSGWGYLVVRGARIADVDFGLRAAWGIAAFLAVAGYLIGFGQCTRTVILGLAGIGFAAFAWREQVGETPSWHRVRDGWRYARAHPAVAVAVFVIVAVALVRAVGGIAELARNEYDDDVAYLALQRRVLDIGDLVEPFSFRRMSAYGGQIVLQALSAARGTSTSIHVLDKSICFVLVLLLLAGHARQRRVSGLWLGLVALVVVLFPDVPINTGSQWSGVVLVLGLYRTVAGEADVRRFALAGFVGAAACTLRQNYIIVVVLFLALVLGMRLVATARRTEWRAAWRSERLHWIAAIGGGLAGLVGWWIAAYASNRTFLFPIVQGTWNHSLSLDPTAGTWVSELAFFVQCCLETDYLYVVPPLWVVLVFVKDARPGRPLTALFIAGALGFAFLVHAFPSSDTYSIWRYAFAFAMPLLVLVALEVADEGADNPVTLAPLGRWLVLAALVVQLVMTRRDLPKQYVEMLTDLRHAVAVDRNGDPVARGEAARYRAMQAALPAGARVAIMLDDPQYLDFDRNTIVNLDTPGYASTGNQMPMFAGAEALRAYFIGEGIYHLAFVRPDRSRYMYRREQWMSRIFTDSELFQIMSAYIIATIDACVDLAASGRVLYDVDGLVVIDLGTTATASPPMEVEPVRRRTFVRALAESAQLHDAWSLSMRDDVVFEDGFSAAEVVAIDADHKWFETSPDVPPTRGVIVRSMHRRAHARLRGAGRDMHLVLRGRVNVNEIFTRPWIDMSLDGASLASARVDATGGFAFDIIVPAAAATGWTDLYVAFSSVSEPWRDLHTLRVARLELFEWEPR